MNPSDRTNVGPSLEQGAHLLKLVSDKIKSRDRLQRLINTGVVSDVFEADPDQIDDDKRNQIRAILNLPPLQPVFTVWKTITIGRYKTAEAYLVALKEAGYEVSSLAIELLKQVVPFAQVEREVDLVNVKPIDLGLRSPRSQLYRAYDEASVRGNLEVCPAEVGPALCLTASNGLSLSDCKFIAMGPFRNSSGELCAFKIGWMQHRIWLDVFSAHPDTPLCSKTSLVFVKPRPLAAQVTPAA